MTTYPRTLAAWDAKNGNVFVVEQVSQHNRRIKVTTRRGYVWACSSAYEDAGLMLGMTRRDVELIWKNERDKFLRFDESAGVYV